MKTIRQPARTLVLEFVRALRCAHTYLPHRNPETLFGFLWGLPIPIFAFAIHLNGAGQAFSMDAIIEVIRLNPLYLGFALHPFFFAVIFGAHGTMRARRDLQIQSLIVDLECHCDELFNANEKLKELDRLKSEFLANVTHELKSPLVTALGYSGRILGEKLGPVTDRQRNALEVSKRNMVRLRGLIEEILDFSRLEAGVGKFNYEPTDLKDLVKAASTDLLLKAQAGKIIISTDLPAAPALVRGDRMKLTQAIVNLMDNAIKFSPEETAVNVSVAGEDDQWHLTIQNSGEGISPETLQRLFQRFSQADGSRSRPHNGMGLGLVIVKKIVEAHGGKVWLESQPGAGTTAHIRLPRLSNSRIESKEVAHATSAIG